MKQIPDYNVPANYTSGSMDMARAWVALEKNKEALAILKKLWTNSEQYAQWYLNLDGYRFDSAQSDFIMHFYIMQQVLGLAETVDDKWYQTHMARLSELMTAFEAKGGKLGV
jgi:hypothetical protein